MVKRPLDLSHDFLAEVLDSSSTALDATMGNGYDTVFLARLAKQVYAFDIQEQAALQTQNRLQELGLTNVQIILDGHEHVDRYVGEIKAAVFNLGYLPKADKSVITKPETTLQALQKVLDCLLIGGRVAIMVYHGHTGGKEEKDAVLAFAENLPQTQFSVMLYQPLNQKNTPPFLIMIEKLKQDTKAV
ncbi:SAM-dependent methyltransferase [Streptococcus chenjunshii]|uniref:SAM-dependent methyltransferase n=1 Tax=Streptococcus chenjunshii TaxID=2173853 RepID=A0A372KJ79_9STRE|nr:class I SAM-dependent methyltransferase [Streptococcus chenjunshii]AXQ78136.1 SAM-dependent methyltransferase [Streptococcus chenjunshii]RFU50174.1 SAM-dependent methyltransferase [Streptococcus chenjunshii]RFU52351.1 SAM-dependent methyltransferase [Streptococcus chenjunshii]